MHIENSYSYSTLLKGHLDLSIFPQERWDEIVGMVDDNSTNLLISVVARKLGLYWPCQSTVFAFLTVGDCRLPTLNHLLSIKSMGKKKAITIILILTYLAERSGDHQEDPNDMVFLPIEEEPDDMGCLQELLISQPNEWRAIATQNWNKICELVSEKYYENKIQVFANDLGLSWPAKRWDSLTVNDCICKSFLDLSKTRGLGIKKLETIVRVLIYIGSPIDMNSGENIGKDIWQHPVIANLNDRMREVFERRLLTAYEKPTLEEMGQQYNVSRERIRQIEREIKAKIAASGLKRRLNELLEDYISCEFLPRYRDRLYLLNSEVSSLIASLSPDLVLAVALKYKSIYHLLSTVAVEAPSGWYFGKGSSFRAMTCKLESELSYFLPAPTSSVAEKLEIETKDLIAVSLLNQLAVPEGVMMLPLRAGRADAYRALRCFMTAISNNRRFWPIDELVEKSIIGSLSVQNQRLYKTSIVRAPRLFMSTSAYVSRLDYAIDIENIVDDSTQVLAVEARTIDADSNVGCDISDDVGNYNTLQELLNNEWPITNTNIREYASKAPYQTNLADNSLIISLCSIPGCIRLAPGVYGPKDYMHDTSKLHKARKLTMDEADIRAYCFARKAGERCETIFPLWDACQEQLWFRKLEKKSDEAPLLRSFISISRQEEWPEQQASEKLKCKELKVNSEFIIKPSWINHRSYNVPSLTATLTALRYARDIGPLSWIRANHITCAWLLTEEAGVSVLISGLVFGLLDARTRPWWGQIPAAEDFDQKWKVIRSLYMEKDIPDWNHPVILEFFDRARELAVNKNLGFIRSESLDHFIRALKTRTE
jgi:hypothetical protein